MKNNQVYKSRLIWEPSFQQIVKLSDERRKLLNLESDYKTATGKDSDEIRGEIHKRESSIADHVRRFVEYNERDDQP